MLIKLFLHIKKKKKKYAVRIITKLRAMHTLVSSSKKITLSRELQGPLLYNIALTLT